MKKFKVTGAVIVNMIIEVPDNNMEDSITDGYAEAHEIAEDTIRYGDCDYNDLDFDNIMVEEVNDG